MYEHSNKGKNENLIFSPRRRKNSRKNTLKSIKLLDGLGRKQSSDKNALKFVDSELKRKKALTNKIETKYFFNNNYYLIIELYIIIFILIEEEIKSIYTNKTSDIPLSVNVILFISFYIVELIIFSILSYDYFLSLYSW